KGGNGGPGGGGEGGHSLGIAFQGTTAAPTGGIMKCDVIAEGVIAAVKEVGLQVPLVVRLEGTNVDLGKKIIDGSGLNVIAAENLDDAAQKIVAAVKVAA
ncbi:MAG: succinate--CoA ligase subunit beta, partial [Methylocystis sp.]